MALTRSTMMWHAGSMAAGGIAVFSAMATNQVDVYAIWNSLNKIVADITTLLSLLAPVAAIFGAAYRTWNAKQVPTDTVAIKPETVDAGPTANTAIVTGKIVGALLIGLIVFGAMPDANAQQRTVSILAPASDPFSALRAVVIADLTAARDDAHSFSDPSEQCWATLLGHATTMPTKLAGVAHATQRLRDLRRGLPKLLDDCAVVKDGARQALLQIFGTAVTSVASLTALGF